MAETSVELLLWHRPLGGLSTRQEDDYTGLLPSETGERCVLTGINTASGYGLTFPVYNVLPVPSSGHV